MSLDDAQTETETDVAPAPDRLLSRIDRAAVFLMLLDDEEASGILGRLSPDELEKLGAAMMALGEIDQPRMAEAPRSNRFSPVIDADVSPVDEPGPIEGEGAHE